MNSILHGDSIEVLKTIHTESVDLLCTDPPYGYSFMGKSWDKTLPDIQIFKECFRVLKPGAFAFVMSAPRSDVCARMMLMLEDAGFEIGFTPIYWTYASGFPKAMNIGKMVDKRAGVERKVVGANPNKRDAHKQSGMGFDAAVGKEKLAEMNLTKATSPEAKALDGSYGGFQPKPAVEVVIVAMKPLSEKTFVDQALKNGKGITWLDDCRIPATKEDMGDPNRFAKTDVGWGVAEFHTPPVVGGPTKWEVLWSGTNQGVFKTKAEAEESASRLPQKPIPIVREYTKGAGRFPANLLVSDDVLNDGTVTRSPKTYKRGVASGGKTSFSTIGDPAGADSINFGDSGSYSRYFDLDAWAKTLPFLIVPKASKREKNEGLEDLPTKRAGTGDGNSGTSGRRTAGDGVTPIEDVYAKNHHPTVKPLKLMSYLITLGSRPGDTVLDPFLGSGTTAIAAKQLGRQYIGIEREAEYIEIAKARLAAVASGLL